MNQHRTNQLTTIVSTQKKALIRFAGSFLGLLFLASTGFAELPSQTWVSATGTDNSPTFSWSQPGRTFAAAIKKTAPGGTISCMNQADYGPVYIDKSITIHGGYYTSRAKIGKPLSSGGPAIVINAGNSGIVSISNIVLEGSDIKNSAVQVYSAKSVEIAKCDILNLSTASANSMALAVMRSISCKFTIADCTFNNGGYGIVGEEFANFLITNSRFLNYRSVGVNPGGGIATLENCVFKNNSMGVGAMGGTTTLTNCQVEGAGTTPAGTGLYVYTVPPSTKVSLSGNKFFSLHTGVEVYGKASVVSGGNSYWHNTIDRNPVTLPR